MTGTTIVLREECQYFSYSQSQHTIINQLHQSGFLSIVLDAAPLELIISSQHAVTKVFNHE